MNNNPILVEVHRGDQVESIHRGSVVAVDTAGRTVLSAGNVAQSVYPRSSLKIFQAIPLLESGAAQHFGLDAAEIALACASHNAEPFHTDAVLRWLHRLDLTVDDLECGAQSPLLRRAAHELVAAGESPTRVHHNCSGKHAGMLTMAKFMKADTRGYSAYHHPTQQAWMQTLSELIDLDVFALSWECDGCGLPAICMPLTHVARAFACYAEPRKIGATHSKLRAKQHTKQRTAAMTQILDAVRAHPHMIAGSERCCTDVIRESAGRVLVKTGAEGVYGGVIPHLGVGFALKIDDGASRAAEVALGAVLKKLNALEAATEKKLQPHFQPTIVNAQGRVTGRIAPVEG